MQELRGFGFSGRDRKNGQILFTNGYAILSYFRINTLVLRVYSKSVSCSISLLTFILSLFLSFFPPHSSHLSRKQIKQTGQQSSILTFYDLVESSEVEQLEFYRLPEPLLKRSLEVLMRQGKCLVLKGVGEEGDGVKFV